MKREWIYNVGSALALAGLLATGVGYVSAGLLAPAWAIPFYWLAFLGWLALAIFFIRRRSLWVLLVPIISASFWVGSLYLGEISLGWTA